MRKTSFMMMLMDNEIRRMVDRATWRMAAFFLLFVALVAVGFWLGVESVNG